MSTSNASRYGFLIADWPGTTKVDRVRFGGDVLSAFPADASPDQDGDGVIDRFDNCPNLANGGQGDLDGDGAGDACDTDYDLDGTYSGISDTNLVPASFDGTFDQAAVLGSPDGSYDGGVVGGPADAQGCFPLSGTVTLTVGAGTVTGTVDPASKVCPDAATQVNPSVDNYLLDMTLTVTSGTGNWSSATGSLSFEGTQSPRVAGVRTSSGVLTGTITP